jgi:hypothetical protein
MIFHYIISSLRALTYVFEHCRFTTENMINHLRKKIGRKLLTLDLANYVLKCVGHCESS